jgi:hypothetical protein
VDKSFLQRRPLQASALILCSAVGAVVVLGAVSFTLVPLVLGLAVLVGWLVLTLLFGWIGIEALAALERWLENDPRFQR